MHKSSPQIPIVFSVYTHVYNRICQSQTARAVKVVYFCFQWGFFFFFNIILILTLLLPH